MPIAAGDVRPKDLTLTWLRGDRNEMLRRATEDPGIDGGETSMAQHVNRLDRGDRSLVAIPVFPLRNFTVRDLYVRKGTGHGRRAWRASHRHLQLGGERRRLVSTPCASSRARHERSRWVVGGADAPATVRLPEPSLPYVTRRTGGSSLSDLLTAGGIDAFFAPLPPQKLHPIDGPIVRAFPTFRAMEQQYFADTGCYPPQHVVLIRRTAWDRDPLVGRRLVEAFNESETMFEAAQRHTRITRRG